MSEPPLKRARIKIPEYEINEVFPDEILVRILCDFLCTDHGEHPYILPKYINSIKPYRMRKSMEFDRTPPRYRYLDFISVTHVCRRWREIILEHFEKIGGLPIGPTRSSHMRCTYSPISTRELVLECAYYGNPKMMKNLLERNTHIRNFKDTNAFGRSVFFDPCFYRATRKGGRTTALADVVKTYECFKSVPIIAYRALKAAVACGDLELAKWMIRRENIYADLSSHGIDDGDIEIRMKLSLFLGKNMAHIREFDTAWMPITCLILAFQFGQYHIIEGLFAPQNGIDTAEFWRMTEFGIYRAISRGDLLFLDYIDRLIEDRAGPVMRETYENLFKDEKTRSSCIVAALTSRSIEMLRRVLDAIKKRNTNGGQLSLDRSHDHKEVFSLLGMSSLEMVQLYLGSVTSDNAFIYNILASAVRTGDTERVRWISDFYNTSLRVGFHNAHLFYLPSVWMCAAESGSVAMLDFVEKEWGPWIMSDPKECGPIIFDDHFRFHNIHVLRWFHQRWRTQPNFENQRARAEWSLALSFVNYVKLAFQRDCRVECAEWFLETFPDLPKHECIKNTTMGVGNTRVLDLLHRKYGLDLIVGRYEYPMAENSGYLYLHLKTMQWMHERGCSWAPWWIKEKDILEMDPVTRHWLWRNRIPVAFDIIESLRSASMVAPQPFVKHRCPKIHKPKPGRVVTETWVPPDRTPRTGMSI